VNKAFGVHARILYSGGLRQAPIDQFASEQVGTTVYDLSNGYSVKYPDYFRTDLRVSWRKNKPGYTRTLSIDIQNLTGRQNVAYYYYDTYLQEVKVKHQLGIIPVIAYRVDF
jgi:outer membrane receptor protein involved in Fe transport